MGTGARGRWSWCGVALLASLALSLPAAAAVVEGLSLAALGARASLVVRGRVESSVGAWDQGSRRIQTHTRLQVLEVLRGPASSGGAPTDGPPVAVGGVLEVVAPGGVVGSLGQKVPGSPRFVPGEEVLLFLERVASGYTPLGLSLGKFTVRPAGRGGQVAVRELDGLVFQLPDGEIVPPGSPLAPAAEVPLPLPDDLLDAHGR